MNITKRLIPLIILFLPAVGVFAAGDPATDAQPAVDTSEWKCKFCTFEEGTSGIIELGVGNVSDSSFKYGEYTGLNKKGAFAIGNASVRSRGDDANYWNIDASNLGLDSRSLGVEGGKQGVYKIIINYNELPHYGSDSASTPFLGSGTDTLTLPGTWVRGNDTSAGQMTDLASSLQPVDLETHRKRLDLGVSMVTKSDWEYSVKYRNETRQGTQHIGGTFIFNSSQLVKPVDFVTNQVDASVSRAGHKWQARVAYYGSIFNNNNASLTWDNPYNAAAGVDQGQLALEPDNQFHQILASGGYNFSKKTRATADIAFGRGTQNQDYLAATVNTVLGSPALPQNSLNGSVDTLNANLKIVSAISDKLRLNAAYIRNDRNNKTPVASYDWIRTDSQVEPARTNQPYSFTKDSFKLGGDYRVTRQTRSSAGFDYDIVDRTYQEADRTNEYTMWSKVNTRVLDNVDLMFKLSQADRKYSSYVPVAWIDTPENPLLRKYNMANRTRTLAGLRADMDTAKNVNIGFGLDYANDDYSNSQIGLTASKDLTVTVDASARLTKNSNWYAFVNHEEIRSNQSGSQTFSTADWTGENFDTVDTAGIGVKRTVIKNKFDIGADYNLSRSRGKVTVITGSPDPAFPDLVSDLGSLKLYATYRLKEKLTLTGAYWYETYNSENWQLDGVAPDTISNVLSLGEQPPTYNVNVIMVTLRYKF